MKTKSEPATDKQPNLAMDIEQAIKLYFDTFNEDAPIMGMEEDEAITRIKEAVETGKIIEQGAEANIPKGALL